MTVCLQAVYLALCLMPVILNIRADREWGVLRKENEVQPCDMYPEFWTHKKLN